MTDAEINRALTEKVLGWKGEFNRPDGVWWQRDIPTPTPDFLTWDGFGLLVEALVDRGRKPQIGSDYDVAGSCKSGAYVNDASGFPLLVVESDLRRALRDAACRAFGIEVES